MIKFFRRIRKSLVSQNKLSKYLVYAVGEIVLVVIGILIALQINKLKIRFQENDELSLMRYELMFLGQDNVSLRKMAFDAFGENFGVDKGKFIAPNIHLLTSKKFDNRLLGFIYTSGYLDMRYVELKEQLNTIINIIDSQIE